MIRRARRFVPLLAVAMLAVGVVLPAHVSVPGLDLLLFPLSLVLLGLATWVTFRRSVADPGRPPDRTPERPQRVSVPGREFDAFLSGRDRADWDEDSYTAEQVRRRLEAVAETTLTRYRNLARAEARERLRTGSWTDDGVAAAFLRGDPPIALPLRARLRRPLQSSLTFSESVTHTVDALMRVVGDSPRSRRRSPGDRIRLWLERVRDAVVPPDDEQESDTSSGTAAGGVPARSLTGHWRGISALTLAGLAVGLVLAEPALLLSGVLGVGYTVFARTNVLPPIDVELDRSITDATPNPGDEIAVTVTIRNEGDEPLPDVRLVDGVPDALAVEDGSPRHATVLQPGQEASFAYTIRARRGVHAFDPAHIRARDLADTVETELTVDADTSVVCRPSLSSSLPPGLRRQVTQYVGQVPTESGSDGVEFYATREYRRGDSRTRIDWKRLARTGQLSTTTYRAERAAEVVLVVDARDAAYVAAGPYREHACDRSVMAAGTLYAAFLETGNRVGVAAFGPRACWLPPTAARSARSRVREILTTHDAFAQRPPDGPVYTLDWIDEFRTRIGSPAQVVVLSPLVDDVPVRVARELGTYGYAVTVVSPDATATDTVGNRVAHLERRARLHELRETDVRVVDWVPDEPVELAVLRGSTRWDR